MQRVADIPDDVKADKTGKGKNDEMLHKAGRCVIANQQHEQATNGQQADLVPSGLALGR